LKVYIGTIYVVIKSLSFLDRRRSHFMIMAWKQVHQFQRLWKHISEFVFT